MKYAVLAGALIVASATCVTEAAAQAQPQGRGGAQGQTGGAAQARGGTSLGSVTLGRSVMADGKPLAAGTYQVRLTDDSPKPGVGQSPDAERYVEFVRGGKVVAREVATVISQADAAQVVKGPRPATGGSRVEMLRGNEYVRVWINRGGMNYILHLPPSAS